MQILLNVNKSKLYSLVKKYSVYKLPAQKHTELKSYRETYWLYYSSETGNSVKVCFEVVWDEVYLRVTCKNDGYDEVFHPSFEELEEFSLIEEL